VNWQTSVWEDREALSRAVAEEIEKIAAAAASDRGRFDLVLAGGRTPRRLYEVLSTEYRERINWSRTHLFWGDERYVPSDNPLSNYRMAQEALIVPLGIPQANIHPMPTYFAEAAEAAHAYEQMLRSHFGAGGLRFDLVLLGIGPEGHTLSLFPGSPALEERERLVVSVRAAAKPPLRLTLTLPAIETARDVFFLVSGEDKQDIVHKLLNASPEELSNYPAGRVRSQGRVILFLDRAAQGGQAAGAGTTSP
jgi:6-phosphogluconolactonase